MAIYFYASPVHAGGVGGDSGAGGDCGACRRDMLKKKFFISKYAWPPKPWFARYLESVAVGKRATLYLAQSRLHCYFFYFF